MKLVNIHPCFALVWVFLFGVSQGSTFAQSMTLEQCNEAALSNNKNLLVVRNNLNIAEQKRQEALSNRSPKVTASADYKFFTNLPYQLLPLSVFYGPEGQYKEAQFGVPHNLGANVQLAMPIYNPQIKTGIKGTEIAAELVNLQVEKTRNKSFSR